MDGPVYPTDMVEAREIRKRAKRYGIDLLLIRQKHLGSDRLPEHITAMADHIRSKGVIMHTSEEVKELIVENNHIAGVVTNGLFAIRPADVLLLGGAQGVTTLS